MRHCGHGKSLDEHCGACEKMFAIDDHIRAEIIELRAAVLQAEQERDAAVAALSGLVKHWEVFTDELRERLAEKLFYQQNMPTGASWGSQIPTVKEEYLLSIDAILADLSAQGLAIVPMKATRKQVLAGKNAVKGFDQQQAWMTLLPDAYEAMLKAAEPKDSER